MYGYGWTSGPTESRRDVPTSFQFESDADQVLEGAVTSIGHEFEGAVVRLSPRYAEPTDIFNVRVERDGKEIATGFAQMA